MPFYDLRCADCKKEFKLKATMSERANGEISCPECGSRTLDAVFKAANFQVKDGSLGHCPHSHICGEGCAHAR